MAAGKDLGLRPAFVRWLIWGAYVISWSIALEMPKPEVTHKAELAEAVFTFSKLVHFSAYALLAGLTGWLRLRGAWRIAALIFIFGHAIATEIVQAILPFGRHGAVADVLLDWVGLSVGIAITWRWWWQPEPSGASASAE
jgi:VanZ family protein